MTVKLKTKFLNNLRKNEILVPHLMAWFAHGEFPDEIPLHVHMNKEVDDAFHPSSSTKCARELYAERLGLVEKQKPLAESQLAFMVGHMWHELLQFIVVEGLGFCDWDQIEKEHWLHSETEAGNPYSVRGFIDFARVEIPGKGTYLVDVKTMASRIFSMTELPYDLMQKYTTQVKLYLEMEGLDQAIILCVNKDSPHRFKEVIVQRDPDLVDEVIDRWETVTDSVATETPPECSCDDPEQCKFREISGQAA